MNSKHVRKNKNFKRGTLQTDDKLSIELSDIMKSITHSGEALLNPVEIKKIKNICKRAEKYVNEAYYLLMDHLQENHAEVRRSAFQVFNELFMRSHSFREQVIFNLEEIVTLTTEALSVRPLHVARELRKLALKTIHAWNAKFGQKYKKLNIAYNYLCKVKKIDFNALEVEDSSALAHQRELDRRKEAIHLVRIKKALLEFKDKEPDIKSALTSLSNCINLLLPHPDDFFIMESDDENTGLTGSGVQHATTRTARDKTAESDSDTDGEQGGISDFREVGIAGANHAVEFDFIPSSEVSIEVTAENTDIIENAREAAQVIKNKYHPSVKAWLEVILKSTAHEEEKKKLKELKGDLDDVLFKYGQMAFCNAEDVSSDSDLEEVPIQTTAEDRPRAGRTTEDSTVWSLHSEGGPYVKAESAPLHESASVKKKQSNKPKPSTSADSLATDRKHKLLAIAPKRPFDIDLYHWEDDKLPVPTMVPSSTDGHRFWVGAEGSIDELPVPEGSAALRTRVIEYAGDFTPVTHSCRVRLPSGRLCPRRDRRKCPFHGEIVPRDESGNCINPADAIRMQELMEKKQQEKPDWQDPKLLAEIKKATGMDLKMPEKGRRKRKNKEFPGLTDLKASENTTTKRLEKKIFNKSAMRKVASAMDKMDQRKFRDKYGDQFNYFYNA